MYRSGVAALTHHHLIDAFGRISERARAPFT